MLQKVTALEYDVNTKQMVEREVEMEMPDPSIMEKERRANKIIQRLSEIDTESIRPLRAAVDGSATEFDNKKLAQLESEAQTLRVELKVLNV